MAIRYLDLISGNDSNDGNTAATPKKTFSSITLNAGDTMKIKASPAPVQLGGNAQATWNDLAKSVAVTWDSPLVKVISNCDVAWTLGAQGQTSTYGNNSWYKKPSGNACPLITPKGPVGLVAYQPLGSAVDFSAYQAVSFWIRTSTVGAQAPGSSRMSLRLCSDANGTTTVNTIPVPALTAANRGTVVTVDTGGNLGSSIQSVALYADQTVGSPIFFLENILACKNSVDGLTLSSLIGKGTEGETYYGIQHISDISGTGCTIYLDNQTETVAGQGRGYTAQTAGLNETLPLWKREPITLTEMGIDLQVGNGTPICSTTARGTADAKITYEFGYSNLSLSEPDGETWIDCQNGNGVPFYLNTAMFCVVKNISGVRGNVLLLAGGSVCRNNEFYGGSGNHMTSGAISPTPYCCRNVIAVDHMCNNGNIAVQMSNAYGLNRYYAKQINNNISHGINTNTNETFAGRRDGGRTQVFNNSGNAVLVAAGLTYLKNFYSRANGNNTGVGINTPATWMLPTYIDNMVSDESFPVGMGAFVIDPQIVVSRFGGVEGDDRLYMTGATAYHEGGEWRCNFNSATIRTSSTPFEYRIGRIACVANRAVTVTAKLKRDSANVGSQIVAAGQQLTGVSADVVGSVAAVSSYEDISITFMPTESGHLDILWRAFTSTNNTNAYLSTVTIKGAATAREVNELGITNRGAISLANVAGGNGRPQISISQFLDFS